MSDRGTSPRTRIRVDRVVFSVDGDRAESLLLFQAGREIEAPRLQ